MRAAAKLGGLSPTAWSDLEAGRHPPTPTTQRAVAAALGWQVDWLDVAERGDDPPAPEQVSRTDDLDALRQQVEALATDVQRLAAIVAALVTAVALPAPPAPQAGQR